MSEYALAWQIRLATPDDAAEACDLLRASVEQLCVPDHGNGPAVIARWLANKRPDEVARWIEDNPHVSWWRRIAPGSRVSLT